MRAHPFDPVSALCGLAAVAVGGAVVVGRAEAIVEQPVWWIAALGAISGVWLLSRSRRDAGRSGHQIGDDVEPELGRQTE